MSSFSGTITYGITLATTGNYASPLTVTAQGYIDNSAGNAIYGPNTQAWTVANAGRVLTTGSIGNGIDLADGGLVANSGTISGPTGIRVTGAAGTVINSGTISGAGTAAGVYLNAGGGVTNSSSGVITGIDGSTVTVINSGTITGRTSVASVSNAATGLLLATVSAGTNGLSTTPLPP